MLLYLNHSWLSSEHAQLSVMDRAVRFGDGVFETLAVRGGAIYQWEFHEARLARGLHALGIPKPEENFPEIIHALLEKNNLQDAFVRILISRGEGGVGYAMPEVMRPSLLITSEPMPRTTGPARIALIQSQWQKIMPEQLPTSVKTLQGLQSVLARGEAAEHGAEDALLLNPRGEIAETSSGNIVWQTKGKLYTPSLKTGALEGSIRHALLTRFPEAIEEGEYGIDALLSADSVCVTNIRTRARAVQSLAPYGKEWKNTELAERVWEWIGKDEGKKTKAIRNASSHPSPLIPHSSLLPWHSPLEYARAVQEAGEEAFALLYSSLGASRSYLALYPAETREGESPEGLEHTLSSDRSRFENAWFGYLGYGLRHATENLSPDKPAYIDLPAYRLTRYRLIVEFDHRTQSVTAWAEDPSLVARLPTPMKCEAPHVQLHALHSSRTKQEYEADIQTILAAIGCGDFYQANLTRKCYGRLESSPNKVDLFAALCALSPSPFSALFKWRDTWVLSSSPERFIALDPEGNLEMEPIKGSAPRIAGQSDEDARKALRQSEKDRAENLMIVDLCRHDAARSCKPGSVRVPKLFEATSYATLHHLSSRITGKKREEISALRAVLNAFPPGSMTGAPKIKAMEQCNALEPFARGVYSGALGWFGGDGSVDLSVVIRTLILEGERFEFQIGGAIVADSLPEKEWEETCVKARAIERLLGVEVRD